MTTTRLDFFCSQISSLILIAQNVVTYCLQLLKFGSFSGITLVVVMVDMIPNTNRKMRPNVFWIFSMDSVYAC